jgi:hypothetical protein
MVMICAAYFDASGKQSGYRFLTVAGASSPIEKWTLFEKLWLSALRDEGVTEFHATDFAASQGEYKDWKGDRPRRSAFIKRLAQIIQKNVNKLHIVTVEMAVWDEVDREYMLSEHFHSPYALAGFTATNEALRWGMRKKVLPLEVFFEDGDEGWGGLKQLCEKYNRFEPIRLPKREAVPFQVGDFFAWKTRITAQNATKIFDNLKAGDTLRELRRELKSLERVMVCPGDNGLYTRRNLVKNCQTFKVPKRNPITAQSA